jgi:cellobiose phosphorylase
MSATVPLEPRRFESPAGLVVLANANGSIRRMERGPVVLNLFPATEAEGGPANLYLRDRSASRGIAWTPLLGPQSPLAFQLDDRGLRGTGEWNGVRVALSLVLAQSQPAWFWHVALENAGTARATLDLLYAQDLAIAPYGAIRMNEYYVSQYLDHTPLSHPTRGWVVASRQNLAVDGRYPWTAIGSFGRGTSFATDALQLHGLATRAGDGPAALAQPSLPGVRRQHEHAMAVIQDEAFELAPGARSDRGFFGWFEPDHPAATSADDAAVVERVLALPEAAPPAGAPSGATPVRPAATLFSAREPLRCRDLTEAEVASLWGADRRHVERSDGDRGALLSFFTGEHTHVALRAKELAVLRPHGHILRTGNSLVPDEAALTTTSYMTGVFNCLVTQGHVSINRFLSTTRSYLGLQREHGQRIFVEGSDGWTLLDVPSAWEVGPSHCRWIYAHDGGWIEVRVDASLEGHEVDLTVEVVAGAPARFLVSNHVALGGDDGSEPVPARFTRDGKGIAVTAPPDTDVGRRFPEGSFRLDPLRGSAIEEVGGDEHVFLDGRSRKQPFLCLITAKARSASLRITGSLVASSPAPSAALAPPARTYWHEMTGPLGFTAGEASERAAADVARLREILPWYSHDALVHYLAPRGLEQYSGGGWGTRDVCQGPAELLLALGRFEALRDLLVRVFHNQNTDGDWPQWFMFFDRERNIRPNDSHGDIVFWPVLALGEYLLAAEDASILDEVVPFFHPDGDAKAERGTIWEHVERALQVFRTRVIPNTHLAAYGHGDWNDSLQPADPAMRERLCSAWTVTLHHQALATLADGLREVGRPETAERLDALTAPVRADFAKWLIVDGEIPGFAHFRDEGVTYLLHPRDRETGIHHRLLPMIHAIIADLLTPAQAESHVAIMREHILGVDGARLFDHPPAYRGGPQTHFQRAESSSFFGREIGIMYTHAHLRYAQAMARFGDADAFFEALRRATPIDLRSAVPAALPRQANCYYSSSDAVVADRQEASARYQEIRAGKIPLEGGWRVYSSGAGIAFRLIHQRFLGLHRGRSRLGIDPVIPRALSGLRAEIELDGRPVSVVYRVAGAGQGPRAVTLNGRALALTRLSNPYRTPGVTVAADDLRAGLRTGANELVVDLD